MMARSWPAFSCTAPAASFVRGGFVYDRDTNTMSDLYDTLVAAGTTGINDLAPPSPQTPP